MSQIQFSRIFLESNHFLCLFLKQIEQKQNERVIIGGKGLGQMKKRPGL